LSDVQGQDEKPVRIYPPARGACCASRFLSSRRNLRANFSKSTQIFEKTALNLISSLCASSFGGGFCRARSDRQGRVLPPWAPTSPVLGTVAWDLRHTRYLKAVSEVAALK
jgi:hypothetical protein